VEEAKSKRIVDLLVLTKDAAWIVSAEKEADAVDGLKQQITEMRS
jgi:hypothetical protein